jgi:hypothetical protein
MSPTDPFISESSASGPAKTTDGEGRLGRPSSFRILPARVKGDRRSRGTLPCCSTSLRLRGVPQRDALWRSRPDLWPCPWPQPEANLRSPEITSERLATPDITRSTPYGRVVVQVVAGSSPVAHPKRPANGIMFALCLFSRNYAGHSFVMRDGALPLLIRHSHFVQSSSDWLVYGESLRSCFHAGAGVNSSPRPARSRPQETAAATLVNVRPKRRSWRESLAVIGSDRARAARTQTDLRRHRADVRRLRASGPRAQRGSSGRPPA